MVSIDYRGFWFTAKFLIVFFSAVFLAQNIPYLFFDINFDSILNNQIKKIKTVRRAALLASLTKIDDKPIKLAFVGDIMLDRSVEKAILDHGGGSYKYPFLKILSELRGYSILFGNLEGPITEGGVNQGSQYSFKMRPVAAYMLSLAGFDIVSVANNHIADWGKDAIKETMQWLTAANLIYVGADLFEDGASGSKVIRLEDGTKLAFSAFTEHRGVYAGDTDCPCIALINEEKIKEGVKEAELKADIVIVSFHFGEEYQDLPNDFQKKIGHLAIDSGADLVIGHHPHVVQPVEKYKEGYIAYSLGNFIFDQNFSEETMQGLLLEAELKNNRILGVKVRKIKLNSNFQPELIY